MNDTQVKAAEMQHIAELLEQVPREMRDMVTAQIIGVINGVNIAVQAAEKQAS